MLSAVVEATVSWLEAIQRASDCIATLARQEPHVTMGATATMLAQCTWDLGAGARSREAGALFGGAAELPGSLLSHALVDQDDIGQRQRRVDWK